MSRATVLALNPGSSSLKAAVRDPELSLSISVDRLGTGDGTLRVSATGEPNVRAFSGGLAAAVDAVAAELERRGLRPDCVAHRVVHGGPRHFQPSVVDEALLSDLREAIPLAPLHLPGDLDSLGHARSAWPKAAHIACFDTGFHHDLPETSRRLPVPDALVALGVRRYGFHGLSIQSVLHSHPDLGNAVIAHLGSGCSVTAVADGRPQHTTMSLTPTGGMISATRTGDLDPEVVLYLIQQHGYDVDQLRTVFDHESGVAGIAQGRHDMRDLLAADDESATLAVDMFAASAAMAIAGCATTLHRWDTLVFTGGIGEHSEGIRQLICDRLLVLGGDPVVLVIAADEEAVLDRSARSLLQL